MRFLRQRSNLSCCCLQVEVFVLEREDYKDLVERMENQKAMARPELFSAEGEISPYDAFMNDREVDIIALKREITSAKVSFNYQQYMGNLHRFLSVH